MHVVQCVTRSGPGGSQAIVYLLVKTLMKLHPDVTFTVLLPQGGTYAARFRTLGIEVVEFPLDRLSLFGLVRISSLLRRWKPDVIHSHGKGAGFYTRIWPRVWIRSKRVHSHHGFHPPRSPLRRFLYITLESYLVKHTDLFVAVSRDEGQEITRSFGRAAEHVKSVPNVVDCSEALDTDRALVDQDLEIFLARNEGARVVTMIARNDPVKNYPLAIASCRMLLNRRTKVVWVFVGIDHRNRELSSAQAKYPGRILALPRVENSSSLIRRSNIVLLTSRKESCPLVILEAFCAGKPVVGTNVGGINELVQHRSNGLLCSQDALAIVQALEELLDDGDLYRQLSRNAMEIGKSMDVKAWADQYYRMYSSAGH